MKASHKTTFVASSYSNRECVQCSVNHELKDSGKFKALTLDPRMEKVTSNYICFKCLRAGHSAIRCNSSRYTKCRSRHHPQLHTESSHNQRSSKKTTPTSDKSNSTRAGVPSSSANISTLHSRENFKVLLSTATVHIKDEHGHVQQIRAVFDSGSEVTFITEE